MQEIQITFRFKDEHNPDSEAHLQQVALEWARSKGGLIVDNEIII